MAGKARVHELAKELRVTSKEILATLSAQGEFAKSASSTVQAAAARRLREFYADQPPGYRSDSARPGQSMPDAGALPPGGLHAQKPLAPASAKKRQPKGLSISQIASICKDFRHTFVTAANPDSATDTLVAEYAARLGVSPESVRKVIAKDRQRNASDYVTLRRLRQRIGQDKRLPRRQTPAQLSSVAEDVHITDAVEHSRVRPRTGTLTPDSAGMDVSAVSAIVLGTKANQVVAWEVIRADVELFDPRPSAGYGYLAWRWVRVQRRLPQQQGQQRSSVDLGAIGQVVADERQLLERIKESAGAVFEHPSLAKVALERGFDELIDSDDIGRSVSDELRHIRDKGTFLRRAIVYTIAAPHLADRVWSMLDQIGPPAQDQLVEVTPALTSAIDGLASELAAAEALLSCDEAALTDWLGRARAELLTLQTGRLDYLRAFRDAAAPPVIVQHDIEGLSFALLPQGDQLRSFLAGMRSAGLYRGRRVDARRLTVLDAVEKHFGATRCRWYEGSGDSRGVNNRYLVLAVQLGHSGREHAVAVSPLAGEHATFVVRHECADAHWARVFAGSKFDARNHGARRLVFTAGGSGPDDRYEAMAAKLIALLECDPADFRGHLVFDEKAGRYRLS
ncbi:translation initiation factor IF-2 [Mycobacteroides abscessus subsp. bolletii]|nr:translation initiation factor IF-2 [Mycobacteroides abscessus subsp. bolletii]SKX37180.1 translation initiation factor IF-2 [Mycobacteroides abscessus subsp. bolletii]